MSRESCQQRSAVSGQRRAEKRSSLAAFFIFVARCSSLVALCAVFFVLSSADAKVYIDITSPSIRRLPVTIKSPGTPTSREIETIVKNDLEFSGLFEFIDPEVPGAEMIAAIDVDTTGGLKVILSVTDLIENSEVLKKRLSATHIRPLAHTIANDIYHVATGKEGIFRTKISYLVTISSGKKELRMMDWDGKRSLKIITKGLTSSHHWSHDGRSLLYSAERDRKWKIYMLDLTNYRERVIFSAEGLNLVGGTSVDERVAFSSSKAGSSEIYSMDTSGKGLKRLTRAFGIDVSPVYSPDGDAIAFVSDRGGTPQIYTMKSNGRRVARVTFEGSYNTSPAWSPDGKWIAYVGRTNGKNQIFMVKSDGNDAQQLTFSGNNESPSFSPDGLFLAFDSDRDGNRGIYIMRRHIEGLKKITPETIKATAPRWSPN